MVHDTTFALDREVGRAWDAFERGLVALLPTTQRGDSVAFYVGALRDGTPRPPKVELRGAGGGRVRAVASSNRTLPQSIRVTPAQDALLRKIGWRAPFDGRNGAFYATMTTAKRYATVASMMVHALRDVHGVHHPALLTVLGLPAAALQVLGLGPVPEEPSADALGGGASCPATPEVRALREAVVQALRGLTGAEAFVSDAGEAVVRRDGAELLVRASCAHMVTIDCWVVRNVADDEVAMAQTAQRNGALAFAKFVVQDDDIYLSAELMAEPLLPVHLLRMVDHVLALVAEHGRELADVSGGRLLSEEASVNEEPSLDDGAGDDRAPWLPGLGVSADLERLVGMARAGRLGATTAARACGFDAARIDAVLAEATGLQGHCLTAAARWRAEGDSCGALDLEIGAEQLATVIRALGKALRSANDER